MNPRQTSTDLSEERLFVGQLVLQLVVDVVNRGGLALRAQVAFLQRDDPFLHVLLLTHGLDADKQSSQTSRKKNTGADCYILKV